LPEREIFAVKKMLGKLWSQFRQWQPVARLLDYELRFRLRVEEEFGLSSGLPTVDLLELLPGLEERIESMSFLGGSASPVEMAMLRSLAREREACHYLEIGTFRGESVVNVAGVCEKAVTVCLSAEEMRKAGYPEEIIGVHGFFSKSNPRIQHVEHDSRSYDFSALGASFDLVFIDGDHAPESVAADSRTAFSLLRDRQSTVVWHDYGFSSDTIRWSVLYGILNGCPPEEREHLYHVSHTNCAIYSRRAFKRVLEGDPITPEAVFSVALSSRKL
jgi:predicted O-methyltransferase YrrM